MTFNLDESCVIIDEKIITEEQKQEKTVECEQQVEFTELQQLVYFDLETGGLSTNSDILQIAAIDYKGNEFNVYCQPTRPISKMSSRINQITFKDNVMYYRNKPVPSVDIREALILFSSYIQSLPTKTVILTAHNAAFDKRFLMHHIARHNLQYIFYPKIIGFFDTVRYFKLYKPGKESYRLGKLTKEYLPRKAADTLHNALTDVLNLKLLFQKLVLYPMLGNQQANNPKVLIQDLVYKKIDSEGKDIIVPKKKTVCKTIEKHITKTAKHMTLGSEILNEIINEDPNFRQSLSRSCKKVCPLSPISSINKSNVERKIYALNRPNEIKRKNDNPDNRPKKIKSQYMK